MKKIIYILLPIAIYSVPCYGLEIDNRVDYVKSYNTYAIQNMKMFKIPASITLAQGILESGSGNSELARNQTIISALNVAQNGLEEKPTMMMMPRENAFELMRVY